MSYLAKVLNIQRPSKERDTKTMEEIFHQSTEEINRNYPSGLIAFIRTLHPELWQKIISLENELEKAWLEGDQNSVRKISHEYFRLFHSGQGEYLEQKSKLSENPQGTFSFSID